MAFVASTLLALAYQLTPSSLPARPDARAPAPAMETRLNNYVLPGPMRPLGNQVMVKLRKLDDKTTGGLFVPTADTEKPKEGIVVLAGPGSRHPDTGALVECPVKEGDLVLLSDYAGEKVDYNGESHIFCDQGGFAWRLWVRPRDKNECVGLYLVPAEDLPEEYTADFELAIVGRRGRVWRRELRNGRATLHKRTAGHGWPSFLPRDEILRGEEGADCPHAVLHEGTLVVTASKIANVRPKAGSRAVDPLARTI